MKKTFGILCTGLLVTAVAVANNSTVSVKDLASGVAYNDTTVEVSKVAKHDPLEIALLALKVVEKNGQLNQSSLDGIVSAVEQSFPSVIAQAEILNVEGGDWQEMLKVSAILSAYSALDDLDGIKLFDANEKSQLAYLSSQLIDSVIYQNEDFNTETFQDDPSNTELLVRLLVGSHEVTGDLLSNLTIENGLNSLLKDYFAEGYQPFDIWEEIKPAQVELSAIASDDSLSFGLAKSDVNANTLGVSPLSNPAVQVLSNAKTDKLTYKFNWDYRYINPTVCTFTLYGKSTVNGSVEELGSVDSVTGGFSIVTDFQPQSSVMLSNPLITHANVACYGKSIGIVSRNIEHFISKSNLNCPDLQDYSLGLLRHERTKLAYYFSSSNPFYIAPCVTRAKTLWKEKTPVNNEYTEHPTGRYYYKTIVKPDGNYFTYKERKVYFERVGMRQGGVENDGLFGHLRRCYASYSIYVQRYDLNGKEVGDVSKAFGPVEIRTGTQYWGRKDSKEYCTASHYIVTKDKIRKDDWDEAINKPGRYID